jgi:hypothetical protein
MTFELPEPAYYGLTSDHTWLSISKEQFECTKADHAMLVFTLIQMQAAYAAGRDSMTAENAALKLKLDNYENALWKATGDSQEMVNAYLEATSEGVKP